jgi:hypothetical protein
MEKGRSFDYDGMVHGHHTSQWDLRSSGILKRRRSVPFTDVSGQPISPVGPRLLDP